MASLISFPGVQKRPFHCFLNTFYETIFSQPKKMSIKYYVTFTFLIAMILKFKRTVKTTIQTFLFWMAKAAQMFFSLQKQRQF